MGAPDVDVLTDFAPANTDAADLVFKYNPALAQRAIACAPYISEHLQVALNAPNRNDLGVQEHMQLAAAGHLLTVAGALETCTDADRRDRLAQAFTLGSVALYGAPEALEAGRLLLQEHTFLQAASNEPNMPQQPIEFLLGTYETAVQKAAQLPGIEAAQHRADQQLAAAKVLGEAVRQEFSGVFALAESIAPKNRLMVPADFPPLFQQEFSYLATQQRDPAWAAWQAVLDPNGMVMATSPGEEKIYIGQHFAPCPGAEGLSYNYHELLWHALRSHNGRQTTDRDLALGTFPGLAFVEEGGGAYLEMALSGKEPDRMYDRYIDTTLAMGILNGEQRSRQELYKISYARHLIRAYWNNADQTTITALDAAVQNHINRLYKGSPGNISRGNQAVLTYDSGYHGGLLKWAEHTARRVQHGDKPADIFRDYTLGMYDPFNSQEVRRLRSEHILPAVLHR